jgi:hypothetical protein
MSTHRKILLQKYISTKILASSTYSSIVNYIFNNNILNLEAINKKTMNLTIISGSDYSINMVIEDTLSNPLNLSTSTISTKMKHSMLSLTSTVITSTVVDRVNGIINLSLTNVETATLVKGRYLYSTFLNITPTSKKVKPFEGIITVV